MTELLTSVAPYLGPSGLLAAVVVYIVISSQRKETKNERDKGQSLIEYRVSQLENKNDKLEKSIEELQNSIINLTITINKLLAAVNKGDIHKYLG